MQPTPFRVDQVRQINTESAPEGVLRVEWEDRGGPVAEWVHRITVEVSPECDRDAVEEWIIGELDRVTAFTKGRVMRAIAFQQYMTSLDGPTLVYIKVKKPEAGAE